MYKVVLHDEHGSEAELTDFHTVRDATEAGHNQLDLDSRTEGFIVEHADGTPLTSAEQREQESHSDTLAHEPNRKMASDAEYWSAGHPK